MSPFTQQDIESELSYAYLHAVASKAGMCCRVATRHEDDAGVDATLVGWGPFEGGEWWGEVDLKIQLKTTVKAPTIVGDSFAYSLNGIARYNDLRSESLTTPRILVVLFLPKDVDNWITHTDDALSLHRCAYWVSLRGAPASTNEASQTVYLPRAQRFDVEGLIGLMTSISRDDIPRYQLLSA